MIRILTGILLGGAVIAGIIYLPPSIFRWLVLGFTLLGLREFGNLMLSEKQDRILMMVLGGVLFFTISDLSFLPFSVLPIFVSFLFMLLLWGIRGYHHAPREMAKQIAYIFFGICYLGLTMPFWVWLHALDFRLVFVAAVPVACCDTFGFFFGTRFGKHKMAPSLSPKKSWEGFVASIVGAIIGFWGIIFLLFNEIPFGYFFGTFTAIGICLVAVFGDLSVSFFKRTVGAKDSGNLIPGHGGMLDRLDAMIFTAPFFYYWITHFDLRFPL